jgi:SNF family Na+-dependent transporter
MIILFIFFVYGLTLDGAADGIWFYVKPDFEKLKDFNVWSAAASQVFFYYLLYVVIEKYNYSACHLMR